MSFMLRPKTIQRLVILLGLIAVLVTGAVVVWISHQNAKQRQLAADRKLGLAAYKSGDFPLALDKLRTYTAAKPDDYEALYAYGVARSRIETGSFRHVAEAKQVFEQLVRMRPDDMDAAHFLLDLYVRFRYPPEMLSLSGSILQKNPSDVEALRAQSMALDYTGKTQQALAAAEKLNEVAPTDLGGLAQTYQLLRKLNRPPAEVMARFRKLQEAHPNDPRFEMMLGAACTYAGDQPGALKWLRAAAAHPISEPTFVQMLARMFDQQRLFNESQALLDRAAAENKDPAVLKVLVQRLWQSGRYEQVVERLKDLDAKNAQTRSDLLALKALSLFSINRNAEAQAIVDALKNRKTDNAAQAWATALTVRFDGVPDQRDAIAKYQNALGRDRDNAVICCWIGDAYNRLGESEIAMQHWRRAAELMPSWPTPAVQLSQALLAANRPAGAAEVANMALAGAPNHPGAAVALAVAWNAALQRSPDPADARRLEQLVDRVQQVVPGEPETLAIAVALKARSGRKEAAVALVRDALQPQRKTPTQTLSRLLAISRHEQLGLEGEISARMSETAQTGAPLTPRTALDRALELARDGKVAEGAALIDAAAKSSTTAPAGDAASSALSWQIAQAEYRDATGDTKAARDAWVALADVHADDAAVQSLILKNRSAAWTDRDFISRTIERVRKLSGEEGQLWRLARAKLLLSGPDKAKSTGEAITLLTDLVRAAPDVAEYRLLLAEALLSQDNRKDATDHLKLAVDLDPSNVSAIVQLAQLLQGQGKFDEAKSYLDRAIGGGVHGALTPTQRATIATLLARQGAIPAALAALKPAREALDAEGKVLLAELSRKSGDASAADAIFAELLKDDQASVGVLAAAADFYGSQGRKADAQAALDRIAKDTRTGQLTRDLLAAQFTEAYGSPDAAREKYAAAAAAAPDQLKGWRELVLFWLRNNRSVEAIAAADEGLKHLPESEELATLKTRAQVVQAGADEKADLRPLIEQLARNPRHKPQVAMLKVVQEARSGKITPEQYAQKLRAAAEANPDYLPVQKLLARQYLLLGKADEAAKVAERTIDARPTDPDAAQLAVGVYESAERWRDAKRSAEKWRQRILERPLEADMAIAQANLALKDPAAAEQQLAPYAAQVRAQPAQQPALTLLYIRALAAGGKAGDARAILDPLLAREPMWRGAAIRMASTDLPDSASAIQWLNGLGNGAISNSAPAGERLALAGAWHAVGTKFNAAEAQKNARAMYAELAARTDATPELLMVVASAQLDSGDLPAAEQTYRRVITADPNQADALNNLAFILLQRGGDLTEARSMVERAIAQHKRATFHDTLARILEKLGERAKAIENFQAAVQLEPENIEALIGLASALQADGRRDKAAELLQRIDRLMSDPRRLSEPLQNELKTLRDHLTRSMD